MPKKQHPHTAAVGAVIRAELSERGWSTTVLAKKIGMNATSVQRWIRGESAIDFDQIVDVGDAFGMQRGRILRMAGIVVDPASTREWIEHDPALDQRARAMLLASYDTLASTSGEASAVASRKDASPSSPPTTRRTRRS